MAEDWVVRIQEFEEQGGSICPPCHVASVLREVVHPAAMAALGPELGVVAMNAACISGKGRSKPAGIVVPCHRSTAAPAWLQERGFHSDGETSGSPFANYDKKPMRGVARERLARVLGSEGLARCTEVVVQLLRDEGLQNRKVFFSCFCWDMPKREVKCKRCGSWVELCMVESHRCCWRVAEGRELFHCTAALAPPVWRQITNVNWHLVGRQTVQAPQYEVDQRFMGTSMHFGEREGQALVTLLRPNQSPFSEGLLDRLCRLAEAVYLRNPAHRAVKGTLPHVRNTCVEHKDHAAVYRTVSQLRLAADVLERVLAFLFAPETAALTYDYRGEGSYDVQPIAPSWEAMSGTLECLKEACFVVGTFLKDTQVGFTRARPCIKQALVAFMFEAELQPHCDRECVYKYAGEVACEPADQLMLQLMFRKEGKMVPVTLVFRSHSSLHAGASWNAAADDLAPPPGRLPPVSSVVSLRSEGLKETSLGEVVASRPVLKTLRLETTAYPFQGKKVDIFPKRVDGEFRAAIVRIKQGLGCLLVNWSSRRNEGKSMNTECNHCVAFPRNKKLFYLLGKQRGAVLTPRCWCLDHECLCQGGPVPSGPADLGSEDSDDFSQEMFDDMFAPIPGDFDLYD